MIIYSAELLRPLKCRAFIYYVLAKFNKSTEWECYVADMLWATATGRTFQDKKNKPTMQRWIEKIFPEQTKPKKITKDDVKNNFLRLKI